MSLLGGGFIGYLLFSFQNPIFKKLSPNKMQERIIKERDYAVNQAIARSDYKCCINPPCTMCYMETNQWNNFTAGTCTCDEFV